MIGSSIKLSPVYSDDKSITVYLPGDQNENWCFLDPTPKFNCFKGGWRSEFSVDLSDVFAFIAPAWIMPWVEDLNAKYIDTNFATKPISLNILGQMNQDFLINPSSTCQA